MKDSKSCFGFLLLGIFFIGFCRCAAQEDSLEQSLRIENFFERFEVIEKKIQNEVFGEEKPFVDFLLLKEGSFYSVVWQKKDIGRNEVHYRGVFFERNSVLPEGLVIHQKFSLVVEEKIRSGLNDDFSSINKLIKGFDLELGATADLMKAFGSFSSRRLGFSLNSSELEFGSKISEIEICRFSIVFFEAFKSKQRN